MKRRFFSITKQPFTYKNEYLTIVSLEDGLTVKLSNNECEYRIDNGSWNTLYANTNTPAVNTGSKIYFRGNLTPTSSRGIGTFNISKKCNVKGNIMSLLYGDEFEGKIDLSGKDYAFYLLFSGCTTLKNAENLILPATTLADYCYSNMFNGCSSLTAAPELPATTLATYCYQSMFNDCSSLTAAPELPATTLARNCYHYMFRGCSKLITAPELPATTLATYCYQYMFQYCSKLTTAPELPATTLATYCYQSMFSGCTSLTAAPELPATTLATGCYQYMFQYCSKLTTAPELPATTLAQSCYEYMFRGCTSLTAAPELPATTLKYYCYSNMFYGCSKLNYIKMLATDISASNCLSYWVSSVASTGTFIKNAAMTSLPSGTSGIPAGWTVVDDGAESEA